MNTTKKSKLEKLKDHILYLQKKHKLKIVWGKSVGYYYDVLNEILYFPPILSSKDYILALHEIGHALTPRLKRSKADYNKTSRQLDNMKKFPKIKSEQLIYLKLFAKLFKKCQRLIDKMQTPTWIWENEVLAWQYAYKTSLIWNNKLKYFVNKCICSYWTKYFVLTSLSRNDFIKQYVNRIYE